MQIYIHFMNSMPCKESIMWSTDQNKPQEILHSYHAYGKLCNYNIAINPWDAICLPKNNQGIDIFSGPKQRFGVDVDNMNMYCQSK